MSSGDESSSYDSLDATDRVTSVWVQLDDVKVPAPAPQRRPAQPAPPAQVTSEPARPHEPLAPKAPWKPRTPAKPMRAVALPLRATTPATPPPRIAPVRVEPPKVEPVRVEPPKVEPVRVEPPKVRTMAARSESPRPATEQRTFGAGMLQARTGRAMPALALDASGAAPMFGAAMLSARTSRAKIVLAILLALAGIAAICLSA